MNRLANTFWSVVVVTLSWVQLPSTNAVADCLEAAPGDMDCNGTIDANDIQTWILGLRNPAAYILQYDQRPSLLGTPDREHLDFDDAEWILCVVKDGSHDNCAGAIVSNASIAGSISVPEPDSVFLVLTVLSCGMLSRIRSKSEREGCSDVRQEPTRTTRSPACVSLYAR
jgi:hypothetical protein